MAETKITDLSAAVSVDRSTNYLEIAQAGSSNKITPNQILGITGDPVGTSDSQTLTSKTLTSPTVSSPTLSGTIAGTYTIGGTPTFPSSVVTLTGTQTLTNKTLTSPTINTATISNPTITTDAISEHTSANGITVDGLNIKDSKLNTNNSVVTANITDGAVTNAKLSTTAGEVGGAWDDWTPTLTNLTQGNGTLVAKYTQVGKTVKARGSFTFGSTSSLSGALTVSLPVTAASDYLFGTEIIGIGTTLNLSTQINPAVIKIQSDTTFRIAAITTVTGSNPVYNEIGSSREVSGTVPFTFGTGDVFTWNIEFEAA